MADHKIWDWKYLPWNQETGKQSAVFEKPNSFSFVFYPALKRIDILHNKTHIELSCRNIFHTASYTLCCIDHPALLKVTFNSSYDPEVIAIIFSLTLPRDDRYNTYNVPVLPFLFRPFTSKSGYPTIDIGLRLGLSFNQNKKNILISKEAIM